MRATPMLAAMPLRNVLLGVGALLLAAGAALYVLLRDPMLAAPGVVGGAGLLVAGALVAKPVE